ncbi:unnamed protein product [Dracunculus medinensis]|uniref:L-aminoadipate-semialdehyde dehydrogenase-phosphopantetheinyl transferase n=1 Tax=Dracunculus medinensis TaxID=318479 RepID=A0A0N4U566_DRAME|nr:unnamed protein product [Dracunculus medinensis]
MERANECKCHRLAISVNKTLSCDYFEAKFRKAVQCVTQEENDKISRFRYKDDSLTALLGRLFLRQATRRLANVKWSGIEFGRTEKGKPYVIKPEGVKFGINVSHQGDYVAFASSCTSKVGVDCMRLDTERGSKSADDYINSMAKSASAEELRMMRAQPTEQTKMAYFYRYWCLKEAILKVILDVVETVYKILADADRSATGDGLLSDLRRLDFRVNQTERYRQRCFINSTTVLFDGKLQDQWTFEESFIDDRHVCRENIVPASCIFCEHPDTRIFFATVNIDFLLEEATVINPIEMDAISEWENFNLKPRKTF